LPEITRASLVCRTATCTTPPIRSSPPPSRPPPPLLPPATHHSPTATVALHFCILHSHVHDMIYCGAPLSRGLPGPCPTTLRVWKS